MSVPMKESGVEWLGQVPTHWETVPPTAVFTESKERARTGDQMLSATQKYGVIPLADFEALEQRQVTKASANLEMRKHVEIGDFVISMRSMDGGLERARAVGSARSSYSVLKAGPEIDGRYFAFLLKSSLYIQALRLTSSFIRDGQDLSFTHVRKVRLPKPELAEQGAIANFLERAVSRIDSLVDKKTRFIELLREKRQTLITRAVTQGLDAGVPLSASCCASELTIPSHWQVVNFWAVARQVSQTGLPDEGLLSVYLDRGVIPYSEGGGLVHKPSETLDGYQLVEAGNFVLNNQQAWRGSVGVSKHRGIVSPAYLIFELSPQLDPDFANFQFRERRFVEEMMLSSQGVGDIQRQVKWPLLRYAKVFLPPIEEQRAIVAHLNRATARIDALIAKTEHSIELLRERRTALITSAVTGKIDLQKAA